MTKRTSSELIETYERSLSPLYAQVAAVLRQRITEGQWRPGERISTLEELEKEFGVARVTVRQAMDLLEKDGLIRRYQGRGTFVTGTPPARHWLPLATDWDTLVGSIKDNVPKQLPVEGPPPALRLDLAEGAEAADYVFLNSLQTRGDKPYAYAQVHLAREVFDRSPRRFRTQAALFVLSTLDDIKIKHAHQTFVIGTADINIAKKLDIALNSPTAEAHCVVVDDSGVAIYVADIIYRGECVKFDINLLNTGHNLKP